ncbi:protein of unknown function [Lutibacter oricola]|uniref:DUF1835 domain-containing protein n=1 Tax=Lutibacter oricola TaxID=762486 RepID=A0A1H2S330_9FLAO|nr:DUF1835 domain-containing protein [Lutibacter oricola]SDW26011.1 protein of unknown function [Lutibacter oricola]
MSKIIHVLNGDSSVQLFKDSGLEGDIVVWRELLCEGPLHTKIASDEFWTKRYAYFEKELKVSRIEYFDKTIKEVLKLEDLSCYNEIVLWFEYDLFCQVNLLAVCSLLLKEFRKTVKFSLVCVGWVKGESELQTLSDFSSEEFVELYKNKLNLSKTNLVFADESWKLYVENDKEKLQSFKFKNGKFQYLQLAIDQHLKRFSSENGLNEIENKILQIITDNSFSEKEIVRELLIWQHTETVYGFGDLQYVNYLKNMNQYVNITDNTYYLNDLGKSKL